MMVQLLDGIRVREQIKDELRGRIDTLRERFRTPGLAVVLVGENAASAIVGGRLGEATRLGGDGSAAIAEAIDKLEALVFAGRKSGNEAESYPDGYEQLIQEYLARSRQADE